ncbi:hypothetical protein F5146DRAFT_1150881 [Armillaria mellea]|nr:hypothetical protein F5146DRAFT_1150881 [Armillaria mellea]
MDHSAIIPGQPPKKGWQRFLCPRRASGDSAASIKGSSWVFAIDVSMDAYYTPTGLGEIVILEMALDGICLPSPEGKYEDAMTDIRAFYEEYAPPVSLTFEDWQYLQSICHIDLGFGGDIPMLEATPDLSTPTTLSGDVRFSITY